MMGERQVDESALFYEFSFEKHVPASRTPRAIDRFVHPRAVRPPGTILQHNRTTIGRRGTADLDAIDPAIATPSAGCWLLEEVHLNLGYLVVPSARPGGRGAGSFDLRACRHGRFRESDLLRQVFETVLRRRIEEGLVGGDGFAVDGSLIKADASRQKGIEGARGLAPQPAGLRGLRHGAGRPRHRRPRPPGDAGFDLACSSAARWTGRPRRGRPSSPAARRVGDAIDLEAADVIREALHHAVAADDHPTGRERRHLAHQMLGLGALMVFISGRGLQARGYRGGVSLDLAELFSADTMDVAIWRSGTSILAKQEWHLVRRDDLEPMLPIELNGPFSGCPCADEKRSCCSGSGGLSTVGHRCRDGDVWS